MGTIELQWLHVFQSFNFNDYLPSSNRAPNANSTSLIHDCTKNYFPHLKCLSLINIEAPLEIGIAWSNGSSNSRSWSISLRTRTLYFPHQKIHVLLHDPLCCYQTAGKHFSVECLPYLFYQAEPIRSLHHTVVIYQAATSMKIDQY